VSSSVAVVRFLYLANCMYDVLLLLSFLENSSLESRMLSEEGIDEVLLV